MESTARNLDVSELLNALTDDKDSLGVSAVKFVPSSALLVVGLGHCKNAAGHNRLLVCTANELEVVATLNLRIGSVKYIELWQDDQSSTQRVKLLLSLESQSETLLQTRAIVDMETRPEGADLTVNQHFDFSTAHQLGPSLVRPEKKLLLTCHRNFLKVTPMTAAGDAQSDGVTPMTASDDAQSQCVQVTELYKTPASKYLAAHGSKLRAIYSFCTQTTQTLVCTGDTRGFVKVWDIDKFLASYVLPAMHETGIWACKISPDGTVSVTGSGGSGASPTADVKSWDPRSGACLGSTPLFTHRFHGLAYSPDGKLVCIRTITNPMLLFWDADRLSQESITTQESFHVDLSGSELSGKQMAPVGKDSIDWSPDGSHVLHSSPKGDVIYIINVAEKTHSSVTPHQGMNIGARFTPDGQHIVSFGSRPVEVHGKQMVGIEVKCLRYGDLQECASYVTGEELLLKDKKPTFVEGADQRKWGLATITCFRIDDSDMVAMVTYTGHLVLLSVPQLSLKHALQAHDVFITCVTSVQVNEQTLLVTAGTDLWLKIWQLSVNPDTQPTVVAKFHCPTLILCLSTHVQGNCVYINFGDAMGRMRVLYVEI